MSEVEQEQDGRSEPTLDQLAFGSAVRELRLRRGLTQEGLGFDAGMHRNYVGAIERGEVNTTFRIMLTLARGLGVPLSLLVRVYERRLGEP